MKQRIVITLASALCLSALLTFPGPAPAATGALDLTFNGSGKALLDDGGNDSSAAIALQPDGALLVADNSSAEVGVHIWRIFGDGVLDQSFGSHGTVLIRNGTDSISGLAVQPDGKI